MSLQKICFCQGEGCFYYPLSRKVLYRIIFKETTFMNTSKVKSKIFKYIGMK